MAHHENYNTRFDVWMVGGDYDPNRTITGPLFVFEDVNYYDMNVNGTDSVEEMKNFHVVAEIIGFDADSCYISLEPLAMTYREPTVASEYEKAFVRKLNGYSIFYMFDTDKKAVVYFVTNDTYVGRGTYTGAFSSGVTISWDHGEFTEKFIYTGGTTATLVDGNGFEWEYKPCDVSEAENILNNIR